ncbi:MAG: tRNA-dihydrouridine synthase [Saccharospirillum sp.]|nr:tRNA-dihydrouridine synthase [Saccharospirillum sp.]
MRLILAPMEGLADVYLRRLITAQGGFDWAVTEFIRVIDQPLPDRVFWLRCPELLTSSQTESGTPVRIQLLGNHQSAMAENAAKAIELGSYGIDLNFGCPSKTVNRSKGGAILLKEPESLYRIVTSVRQALPLGTTLSAKMRLGYEDATLMLENALALQDGGADEITVHARTKVQGYTPPAHWHCLEDIRQALNIAVIANGEIWSPADYERCREVSGCEDAMLGRGAIRFPDLAQRIRSQAAQPMPWSTLAGLVEAFWKDITEQMPQRYCAGRLKQWLHHLRQAYPEAEQLWQCVRTETDPKRLTMLLNRGS